MRYGIVRGDDPASLCDKVNAWIAKGWEPIGGISHSGNRDWARAVINPHIEPVNPHEPDQSLRSSATTTDDRHSRSGGGEIHWQGD